MKSFKSRLRKTLSTLTILLLGLPVLAQPTPPGLERAAAVKAAKAGQLMTMPEIVGVGVGLEEQNRGALHIMVVNADTAAKLPRSIDGVPVVAHVTGKIYAIAAIPVAGGGKPSSTVSPTSYFPRPVPIGVSTGNATVGSVCSAGTLGCRVRNSKSVFALSNNHVYANENAAELGQEVAQPGTYDTHCYVNDLYDLGVLDRYEPILFNGGVNYIDAAIALTETAKCGTATPAGGYGTPKSTPASAALNQPVQKYGRTTALTKGTVAAVDITVNVGYSAGTAIFAKQILVYSGKPFIKSGDSGSLLVTNPDRVPVGLLFAGNQNGQYAFANDISEVLKALHVDIDGE